MSNWRRPRDSELVYVPLFFVWNWFISLGWKLGQAWYGSLTSWLPSCRSGLRPRHTALSSNRPSLDWTCRIDPRPSHVQTLWVSLCESAWCKTWRKGRDDQLSRIMDLQSLVPRHDALCRYVPGQVTPRSCQEECRYRGSYGWRCKRSVCLAWDYRRLQSK